MSRLQRCHKSCVVDLERDSCIETIISSTLANLNQFRKQYSRSKHRSSSVFQLCYHEDFLDLLRRDPEQLCAQRYQAESENLNGSPSV